MSSTYTNKNRYDFWWTFFQLILRSTSSILCFPQQSCRVIEKVRSRQATSFSIESHCFSLRPGGSLVHTRGHSFSSNRNNLEASDRCTWVWADTTQGVWTFYCRHLRSCCFLLREYCSVSNVVCDFATRSTTPPLYCWTCVAISECFKWQNSRRMRNEQVLRIFLMLNYC